MPVGTKPSAPSSAPHTPGVVLHALDPRTRGLESGESQVEGHPWLLLKLEVSLGYKRPSLKKKTQKIFLPGCWTKGHSDMKLAKSQIRSQESTDVSPCSHMCLHVRLLMYVPHGCILYSLASWTWLMDRSFSSLQGIRGPFRA